MTRIITVVTIIIGIFFSCKPDPNPAKPIKINKKDTAYEVSLHYEKIMLISIAKNLKFDTTFNVLNDYYIKCPNNPEEVSARIDEISKKYNLPRKKVANILFEFIYGQVPTEEEIYANY